MQSFGVYLAILTLGNGSIQIDKSLKVFIIQCRIDGVPSLVGHSHILRRALGKLGRSLKRQAAATFRVGAAQHTWHIGQILHYPLGAHCRRVVQMKHSSLGHLLQELKDRTAID